MPAVVSDTSPLIYLTCLGHFGWLRELYGDVIIPQAVWDEIATQGSSYPEASTTRQAVEAGWIRVQTATQRHSDDLAGLDSGEREAILLAGELNALLIIDEAEGRKRAVAMGLRVTGILGMMLESKARGLIDQVAPELARLVTVTTFRISEELREGVLKLAGESESNP
jgi:uncharacterized protein